MANTRDTLGDQGTLDAILAGTLETFEESGLSNVNTNPFRNNHGLKTIILPSAVSISNYAFNSCADLEAVDLSTQKAVSITGDYAFTGSSKLKHVIIRSPYKASLGNVAAFGSTPIAAKNGAIYVPADLVATYKADSKWNSFPILPISRYPATDFKSTIEDSWEQIFAAEADGSYLTKYSVGDVKTYDDGTNLIPMQIVAFDRDDLADGSGKAKITWVEQDITYVHNMNASNTNAGGIKASAMQRYLDEEEFPKIPAAIRNNIKTVKKNTLYYESSALTTKEEEFQLFILSMREIFGGTSYENAGVDYTDFFSSSSKRIKKYNGSAYNWWSRSAYNSTQHFRCVNNSGNASSSYASYSYGVARGFCT